MNAFDAFAAYHDTCAAIHDALCVGAVALAEALRAERDRLAAMLEVE